MKKFLRETMGHDDIMAIDKDELKTKMEGNSLLSRIQYRKQVGMAASKPTVAKLEVVKYENAHASALAAKDKNQLFGFRCLHYSVSEACENVKIAVLNKSETACKIRVRTVDD